MTGCQERNSGTVVGKYVSMLQVICEDSKTVEVTDGFRLVWDYIRDCL